MIQQPSLEFCASAGRAGFFGQETIVWKGLGKILDDELLALKIAFRYRVVAAFERNLMGLGKILPQQGSGCQGGFPGGLLNLLEQV